MKLLEYSERLEMMRIIRGHFNKRDSLYDLYRTIDVFDDISDKWHHLHNILTSHFELYYHEIN